MISLFLLLQHFVLVWRHREIVSRSKARVIREIPGDLHEDSEFKTQVKPIPKKEQRAASGAGPIVPTARMME